MEAICKGSIMLGSACGKCQRCRDEAQQLLESGALTKLARNYIELRQRSRLFVEERWKTATGEALEAVAAAFDLARVVETDDELRKRVGARIKAVGLAPAEEA